MLRVMICEDDMLQALDLASMVEQAGASVCGIFSNGHEAIKAAEELKPNIVLVDLTLADGATGADVAFTLAGRGCRVIVLSGSNETNATLCRISHCFVEKPAPAAVIQQVISAHAA